MSKKKHRQLAEIILEITQSCLPANTTPADLEALLGITCQIWNAGMKSPEKCESTLHDFRVKNRLFGKPVYDEYFEKVLNLRRSDVYGSDDRPVVKHYFQTQDGQRVFVVESDKE